MRAMDVSNVDVITGLFFLLFNYVTKTQASISPFMPGLISGYKHIATFHCPK